MHKNKIISVCSNKYLEMRHISLMSQDFRRNSMFNRQSYLDKLIQAKDSDFVKVLTGVRRCGKSTLLMLYKDWLLERGVEEIKLSKSVMRRWKMNL